MEKLKNHGIRGLRWLEKYTKTDMVYLAHGGFWLTLGQTISTLSSFVLAIAFANLVPKEVYGTYQYALSVMSMLTVFTLTGMNTAVAQAVARNFEGTLKKSFWVQIKWNLLMFLASLSGAIYYFIHGNKTLAITLLIIGIFSPLSNSANTYTAFLNGKKYFSNLSKFTITSNLLTVLAVFITILITKNPLWIIFINVVSTTTLNLILYSFTIKKFKPNNQDDPYAVSYGKHLSFMNILNTISSQIDAVFLFHFLGAIPLALYSLAIAPIEQLRGIIKNIIPISMPKFATIELTSIKKTIWRKVLVLALVLGGMTLLYIIFIPFVFKVFFPKYIGVIMISQVYSLTLIPYFMLPLMSALQAHKRVKDLYIINNVTPIIQISFLFVGIYFFGLFGAITAQVLYRLVSAIFIVVMFKRVRV